MAKVLFGGVSGEGAQGEEEGEVLSENQKAATYIGWNDRQVNRCESRLRTPQGTCWTCGAITPADSTGGYNKGPHDTLFIPAPDMSDPCNYMKALEAVDSSWSVQHDRIAGIRIITFGKQMITWPNSVSIEDTIIAALASLYDAEHPDAK